MKVVLLADNNPRAAIACIRSLRRKGIEACPAMSASTGWTGRFVSLGSYRSRGTDLLMYRETSEEDFCGSLLSFRERIGRYILFPSGERVLRWAIGNRDKLAEQGIILPTVDLGTYERISDKRSFASLCASYGLGVPKEYRELPKTFGSRFVVKPKSGIWGRDGVLTAPILVENDRSFQLLRRKNIQWDQHFIQEYVDGPSYYYCALYKYGEKQMSMVQKTLVQQPNGKSVIKAAVDRLPEDVVRKLDHTLTSLRWHGLLMIEVKESGGTYYGIECNPRIWGPLQLAVDNGFDFPYALWLLAMNRAMGSSKPPYSNIGYLWSLGYFHGLLLKIQSGTNFQFNKATSTHRIVYRDVWLRRDSLAYTIVEICSIFGRACRYLVKKLIS